MDKDFEGDYVFSEDEDNDLQNQTNEPWQSSLPNLSERVSALHNNNNVTDITLTFHESEITYDAHRQILATSSPIFEGILSGPMRTEGYNILLHDDDPLAMKHVISHCYGNKLKIPDQDMALKVYKLADKYLIDALKKDCCEFIGNNLGLDNKTEVIEFAERYNFTGLIKDLFEDALYSYDNNDYWHDEPDNIDAFAILMGLSDTWIQDLLSESSIRVLDFHQSWKFPKSPLEDNRLSTILSNTGCSLKKFYGCVNAEIIQQFPQAHITEDNKNDKIQIKNESVELHLSVTDLHHARRVMEAINQQNRFENHFIAIHISCEEIWPKNWSPIRPERTHRPSLLFISDADDDKAPWVIEATKAFLSKCEGSRNRLFLQRSNFTPNGFIKILQQLFASGVKYNSIIIQSPHITWRHVHRYEEFIKLEEEFTGFMPDIHICDRADYHFKEHLFSGL